MNQPQNMTLQILRAIQHKTPIGVFEGRIQKVYDRKSGTNDRGEWSMQRMVVTDANGEDVTVLLDSREPMPYGIGTRVSIECKHGDRGPSGVYAHDDTYQGKTERQIKVTPTGIIKTLAAGAGWGDTPAPAASTAPQRGHYNRADYEPRESDPDQTWSTEPPRRQEPRQEARHEPRQETRRQAPPQDPGDASDDLKRAKRALAQITNLHTLCVLSVDRLEAPEVEARTGQPMSEAMRQAAVASVFIKAERLGLVEKMPTRPFKDEEIA